MSQKFYLKIAKFKTAHKLRQRRPADSPPAGGTQIWGRQLILAITN